LKDNKDYVDFVKNIKNDDVEFFKNMLLKQELYDKKCIMNYVQNQATDIRNMIKSKLNIEELM
jgi:hypothetical protein